MGKNMHSRVGEVYSTVLYGDLTIIGYNDRDDVIVRFEDGTIKEHCRMQNIKSGYVANPVEKRRREDEIKARHVGESYITKNGKATIIEYINSGDVTIEWESGAVQKHMQLSNLRKIIIRHD